MATWYVNAESSTQDGTTVATGYHSIGALIDAKGALTADSTVNVVYTATDSTEIIQDDNYAVMLKGLIQAHDLTTFPTIIVNACGYHEGGQYVTYRLSSDVLIKHLTFKRTATPQVGAIFRLQNDSTNVTLDSCKIFDAKATEGFGLINGNFAKEVAVKNCLLWANSFSTGGYPFGLYFRAATAATNKCVFVNNSFYIKYTASNPQKCLDISFAPGQIYNNIFYFDSTVSFSSAMIFADSNLTGDCTANYNMLGPDVNGNVYTSEVNWGASNLVDKNPLYKDASNYDLSVPSNSPAVDAGTNNAYTTTYDILGNNRTAPYDIGAYEFIPPLSYFVQSTVSDGAYATSYLTLSKVVSAVQTVGSDLYFDTTGEIGPVYVYYTHQDGQQMKRVVHDAVTHQGTVKWTSNARAGEWQKTKVRVFDNNGATAEIPRSVIGTTEDCSHSSGLTTLNTL